MHAIIAQIAAEIKVQPAQVKAAVNLLDGGATVPFVARYRKEATGGLDDIQLRELHYRLGYLRELADRRAAVLDSIESQGKLTPELRAAIDAAPTKQELEDLYLPYKQKRRTKGQIAREAGIEPLADKLFANPLLVPADEAAAFVKAEKSEDGTDFTTVSAVLDGVRDILSERWAEDAPLVQGLREWLWAEGLLSSKRIEGKDENNPDVAKFRDYFDYDEPIGRVPSHRALAVFRGRALEFLEAKLVLPEPLTQTISARPEPDEGLVKASTSSARTAGAATLAASVAARTEGVATRVASVATRVASVSLPEARIAIHLGWSHSARPADDLIRKCVAWAWKVKLSLSLERDLFTRLREDAEKVAIKVFGDNLRDLLLAAPAGKNVVMGLDPGIRTGVKVAVVDATGKLLDTATVYPHEPRKDWDGALHTLGLLAAKHGVQLIAIGNGTASRETDKLAGDLIKQLEKTASVRKDLTPVRKDLTPVRKDLTPVRNDLTPVRNDLTLVRNDLTLVRNDLTAVRPEPVEGHANPSTGSGRTGNTTIQKVVVSEAGASVYSASEFASQEMPDVDVSLRGAASIARRLQDPLAELVKIDPKSIGVGQYQHDVSQSDLARSLDAVVEDCVNSVGVDLNTASVPLLGRVSGLSGTVAKSVVRWREQHGAFKTRQQLLEVSGLGAKTFEQCAGFLRISGGDNPLDSTGVHPETYPVIEKLLGLVNKPIHEVMGRSDVLKSITPQQLASDQFGAVTVGDILVELEKPGRDPRPNFQVARFNDGVEDIRDLKEGMILEGTVSNVAAFGAFVDLGVHQDGLVHVSQLSHKFTTDAREVVKTGQIVKVKVMEVDVARKRIALSMKLDAAPAQQGSRRHGGGDAPRDNRFESARGQGAWRGGFNPQRAPQAPQSTAMGDALAKLQSLRK